MSSFYKIILVLLGLALLLLPPFFSGEAQGSDIWPGAEWKRDSPEAVGLDQAGLDRLAAYMEGRGCVTRHGRLVYEWGDASQRGDIASASKPWLTFFLMLAVEEGLLDSVDSAVVDFMPCLADLNPALDYKDRSILFRHLGNQTSCYGVSEAPGTAYNYNDWQTGLFSEVLFQKIYGLSVEGYDTELLIPRLTARLQCEDHPTFHPFGVKDRPGRVGISPRDFCRFGYLFLRGGRWHQEQILPEEMIRTLCSSPLDASLPRSTAVEAERCAHARSHGSQRIPDDQCDHAGSYSWMWWVNGRDGSGRLYWPDAPQDCFAALGHKNGQRGLAVIPSLDIVFSWNSTVLGNYPESPAVLNEAFKKLVAAVQQ